MAISHWYPSRIREMAALQECVDSLFQDFAGTA